MELSGDHADVFAFAVKHRQRAVGMMRERRLDLLAVPRQADPGLDAEEP
jgi:hypothetical protein